MKQLTATQLCTLHWIILYSVKFTSILKRREKVTVICDTSHNRSERINAAGP